MALGQLYKEMNDNNKALEYLSKSVEILENLKHIKNLVKSINSIGNIYYNLKLYDKSLSAYFEALSYTDSLNDKSLIETIYNNIGLIYSEKGDSKEALKFYFKSLKKSKVIQDTLSIAVTYLNIGNEYIKTKEKEKAIDFINKSIKILKTIDSPIDLGAAYLVRGSFFKDINLSELAKYDLSAALAIYKELDLINGQRDAYFLLAQTYIISNNSLLANNALLKYNSFNDSLFFLERIKSLEITNAKIDALTQVEKLDSELKLEKEKSAKLLLIIVSIITLLSMIVVFFFARKRLLNKLYQNKQLLDFVKVNNRNLYDSFSTDVKDRMYLLGNYILESNDSKNYELLKSSFDDVSHSISDVLVKYNIEYSTDPQKVEWQIAYTGGNDTFCIFIHSQGTYSVRGRTRDKGPWGIYGPIEYVEVVVEP